MKVVPVILGFESLQPLLGMSFDICQLLLEDLLDLLGGNRGNGISENTHAGKSKIVFSKPSFQDY